jgi:hypothetical protein
LWSLLGSRIEGWREDSGKKCSTLNIHARGIRRKGGGKDGPQELEDSGKGKEEVFQRRWVSAWILAEGKEKFRGWGTRMGAQNVTRDACLQPTEFSVLFFSGLEKKSKLTRKLTFSSPVLKF